MSVINLNDYRKEGAAVVRPSPSIPAPVKDKSERHQMHRLWREAESVAEYYRALSQFTFAAHRAADSGLAEAAEALACIGHADRIAGGADAVALQRAAIASLIRTPAPTQQQIWWKKRQLKRDRFLVEFISAEEVTAAIAADEAFHRANPRRKPRHVKGADQ